MVATDPICFVNLTEKYCLSETFPVSFSCILPATLDFQLLIHSQYFMFSLRQI